MELARIFSKSNIIILLILVIINGILFNCLQCNNSEYVLYNDMLKKYRECMNEYNEYDYKLFMKQYKEDNPIIYESDNYNAAQELFEEKMLFVYNYREKIEKKIQSMQAFKNSNNYRGYSYLEIVKTEKDLRNAMDYSTDFTSDIWMRVVTEYGYCGYFIILMMLVIIYGMQIDSAKLQLIIKSTPKGRIHYEIKRVFLIALLSFIITFTVYGSISIIALYRFDGWDGLTGCVSSDISLYLISYGMKRWLWLCFNVMRIGVAICVISIFLYSIISFFNNKNIGLAISCIFMFVEFLLYETISEKSSLRILRYFNLKYMVNSERTYFQYKNWGTDTWLMDLRETIQYLELIIIFISIVLMFVYIKRKTIRSYNVLAQVVDKVKNQLGKMFASLPSIFIELWKICIKQKLIFMYIIVLVVVKSIPYAYTLKYNLINGEVYNFCNVNYDLSNDALISLQTELQNQYDNIVVSDSNMLKDKIFCEKIQALDYVNTKRQVGVDVALVSQYQYNKLFDDNQKSNKRLLIVVVILAAFILNIGIISFEKEENVLSIINTSANRYRWFIKKLIINIVVNSILCILVYCYYYTKLLGILEINNIDILIQSIQVLSDFPICMTIRQFIIMDIICKSVFVNIISLIAVYMSKFVRYKSGLLAVILVHIPYLLYLAF